MRCSQTQDQVLHIITALDAHYRGVGDFHCFQTVGFGDYTFSQLSVRKADVLCGDCAFVWALFRVLEQSTDKCGRLAHGNGVGPCCGGRQDSYRA
jgi:hypothetical protein